MVSASHGDPGIDRLLFYGQLSPRVSRVFDIKKSDNMGIPIVDENFIHEGMAQKMWVTIRQGRMETKCQILLPL